MLIVTVCESFDQTCFFAFFGQTTRIIQDTDIFCVHESQEVIIVVVSCSGVQSVQVLGSHQSLAH